MLEVLYEAALRDEVCGSSSGCKMTFGGFLQVILDIREKAKDCRWKKTWEQFDRFDTDRSGQLSVLELSALFQEMGLAPTCRHGQDEIKRLLSNRDADQNGQLDFDEFQ